MRSISGYTIFGLATTVLLAAAGPAAARQGVTVTGRVTMLEQGDRASGEVGQAVVWLTGSAAPAGVPGTTEMATEGKQFVPRLRIVATGANISFPNHDPFNHNVFSLSPESPFDLGVFGRGEVQSARFDRAGVVRIFCNVHAQMRGLVLVLDTGLSAQPGSDGSFTLADVPPGEYVLHAWHERAPEVTRQLRVLATAPAPLQLTLDVRGYRLVQHRDKEGKSYGDRSRRY
jgi:plastocyanin